MSSDIRDRLEVIVGDITTQSVDAIVNAANSSLMGGGGVDGAIHRAAGPELLEECKGLGGCATGDAKVTLGYRLPARHVIHTVGPIWSRHPPKEANDLLAACYRRSLEEGARLSLETVAFPAISTGVFGFPPGRAAAIAVREVTRFLHGNIYPGRVLFVCFTEESAGHLHMEVNTAW
ncbi:MAG: O-acetyl-ADP-ribose deacetylase [Rhodospirillum sp.]|nr:O-acetyl-ADP-ribose deacetylase [Rhodospirillum sp.]MCF8487894.1 O-acetyl-ADP-ribose deacetylase [Rhodospirillum sp.]MCF8501446.1 O-acetyl-ADP-ribose deacetylase [Rhodospirillum sp.]